MQRKRKEGGDFLTWNGSWNRVVDAGGRVCWARESVSDYNILLSLFMAIL